MTSSPASSASSAPSTKAPQDFSRRPDWLETIATIDRLAADAAEADVRDRQISSAELAAGFVHLARLRRGDEPDYVQRGLGSAYLVYYLAKRASIIAAVLPSLDTTGDPVRVLDIGSGTNATALALATTFPGRSFELDAVEPSREMAAAGQSLAASLPVAITDIPGSLDDVLSGDVVTSKQYDLVVLSALLPYGWEIGGTTDKVAFGDFLERRLAPGGRVIVIEPRAKSRELAVFASTLERTNILSTMRYLNASGEPPDLRECTGLLARWQAQRGFRSAIDGPAEELVTSALRLGLSVQLADVALIGERRIGPTQYSPEVVLLNASLLANPPVPPYRRERVNSSVSRRTIFATTAAMAAAIATIAWAITNAF